MQHMFKQREINTELQNEAWFAKQYAAFEMNHLHMLQNIYELRLVEWSKYNVIVLLCVLIYISSEYRNTRVLVHD